MRVFLIRHAQSENNILTHATWHRRKVDPGLTALGFRQRQTLADFAAQEKAAGNGSFQITHLYTSAMYRSLLTAQALGAALDLHPRVWTDLHERGGMYQHNNGSFIGYGGMSRSAILSEFPGYKLPDSVSEDGWYDKTLGLEPEARTVERAQRVADALRKRGDRDAALALVSHGDFLHLLLEVLFQEHTRDEPSAHFMHQNAAITRIDFLDGQPQLRYFNQVEHLPAALHSI